MHWLDHRIPPPAVAVALAALMALSSSIGPQFAASPGARLALALAVAAVGITFDVAGLVAFRASRTTVNPLRPERASALVTSGIYRFTRNPMYVGLGLLLTALATYLGAALPFAGPVLFVVYITRFQIVPEERILRRTFGGDYVDYASRVRRWL